MFSKVLSNLGISTLNPMQLASIEACKSPSHLVLLSPTGSGKTLAFLLPILNQINSEISGVQALIIVPSRELGLQIEQVFKQMNTGLKVNCCYGGHSTKTEKNNLSQAPSLLIGTPGRLAYHIRKQNFNTTKVHTLVLDEFDKALEYGFKEDMSFIIQELHSLKSRILTSATNLEEIPSFTGLKNHKALNFLNEKSPTTTNLVQKYIKSEDTDKLNVLFGLICKLQEKSTLVFCNHREAVERISSLLLEKGIPHGIFHGGMEQEDRERALIKFRNGTHRLLITTDLASRGLDIPEIETVIHYQLPLTLDSFTHRNGRTARMNAEGVSYLLLSVEDRFPKFISPLPEKETLPVKNTLPKLPSWNTLYIAAGKKEKINKMDIVGMLMKVGNLNKDELGRVEVLDHTSYAAVNSNKIESVVELIKNEKIKGKKVKMAISN